MADAVQIPTRKVLIVDDSKFVRTTFNRILSASFAVREEADGEAGWKALESDPSVVMVFSDLSMPKLDGYELVERIRASVDARIKEMPVVIISGNEDEASKKRARDAGANDFIAKSADAPEVLSRIDNLLRLVQTKQELEQTKQAVEATATHDPVTGTFTQHYLLTEGRKHFSHARRHGGPLSVVIFRIESYNEIAEKVGKEVADQLLARVAKMVAGTLRTEDSIGRSADTTFTVISAGTSAPQALAFARRLHDQLERAQVTYNKQQLKIRASVGIGSLGHDTAATLEELIKIALQRLEKAASSRKAERIVGQDEVSVVKPPTLPSDIERALQALENLNAERLGDMVNEILRRLLPFLHGAFRRLRIELPVEKIKQILQGKPKP